LIDLGNPVRSDTQQVWSREGHPGREDSKSKCPEVAEVLVSKALQTVTSVT
jgi:hypothetical protein